MLLTDQTLDDAHGGLLELGLRRRQADVYAGDELTVVSRDGWLTVHAEQAGTSAPPERLDRPGLWKHVDAAHGARLAFDVPLAAMNRGLDDAADIVVGDLVLASVKWALETRDGMVGGDWVPPSPDELSIAPTMLSFRRESYVQQAAVTAGAASLALHVTIGRVAAGLSEGRLLRLRQIVADAARWRLVRIGLRGDADGGGLIEARIDLSGAPACVRNGLIPVAVDALRHAFSLLVSTVTFLGDSGCASRALDDNARQLLLKEQT